MVDAERNIGNTLFTGSNPVLTTKIKIMIYILSAIGLVLFNMFLFKRNRYYMKHKEVYDEVYYISDPSLRLLVLLLCLVPALGIFVTMFHIAFTIVSYSETKDNLPSRDGTQVGKLNKFLDKLI